MIRLLFIQKKSMLIILFLGIFTQLTAQNGSIHGKITEHNSDEPIPFVSLELLDSGKVVQGTTCDLDGFYGFNEIIPGKYELKLSFIGYQQERQEVIVSKGITTKKNFQLKQNVMELKSFEIQASRPLISTNEVSMSMDVISPNEIKAIPVAGIVNTKAKKRHKKDRKVKSLTISEDFAEMEAMSYDEEVEEVFAYAPTPDPIAIYDDPGTIEKEERRQKHTEEPVSGEHYELIEENPIINTINENTSTFSIDVDVASYSNIRRFINAGQMPKQGAVRLEEMINYFDYSYDTPKDTVPFAFHTEVAPSPWNLEKKLVHIGLKGKEISKEQAAPNNLVFLIDVSGSMSGYNRLGLVQRSLNLLVNELRPQDYISLVVYAGSSGLVLPATSCKEKSTISAAINRLSSGGSTAGGAGIQLAYKTAVANFLEDGNNRVILCTDGDFNVGVSSQSGLITLIEEKRNSGVFLSVLGVGTGNYQDQKMEQLADHGNGNYAYLDNIKESQKVLVDEMMGTLNAIAKDVKIQVEFDSALVKNYRLIGYENRALENKDFKDDLKDAGEIGAGHTVTAMYEVELVQNANTKDKIVDLRIRYKQPKGSKSMLLTHQVVNKNSPLSEASENLRFSASVASFGMMLRGSKHLNGYSTKELLAMANSAIGKDAKGYRNEFLKLIEKAQNVGLIAQN
jgi:Ca-activated chloride channel family protein